MTPSPRGLRRADRSDRAPDPIEAIALAASMLRSGLPDAECWSAAGLEPSGRSLPAPADRELAAAVALSRRAGVPLADVLEALQDELEAGRDAEAARDAALAGPSMSAAVMTWLPLGGAGLAAAVDPASVMLLLTTPLGWALLAAAAVLAAAGRLWMAATVGRARKAAADPPDEVGAGAMLRLLECALASGADALTALDRVGEAAGGERGGRLGATAAALRRGGAWEAAWSGADDVGRVVEPALRRSAVVGSSPGPSLAAARRRLARDRAAAAQSAAARAGVTLVLPVSLCLLPAFVLVAVVPLVIALARQVGPLGLS